MPVARLLPVDVKMDKEFFDDCRYCIRRSLSRLTHDLVGKQERWQGSPEYLDAVGQRELFGRAKTSRAITNEEQRNPLGRATLAGILRPASRRRPSRHPQPH